MILLPLFTVYYETSLSGHLWPLPIAYTGTGLPLTVFIMATRFRAVPFTRIGSYRPAADDPVQVLTADRISRSG